MIYRIYKATNQINGKCYIGFTKHRLTVRKNQHIAQSRWKSKHGLPHSYFAKALMSYGPENFEWETLYESFDREHCLGEMEDHFITQFDAYNNGYNLQLGGSANLGRFGNRNGMFGKNHSEEVKQSLRDQANAKYAAGRINPMLGKERSDLSARNRLPKRWMTKNGTDKNVLLVDVDSFLLEGWSIGRASQAGPKKLRATCPQCNIVVDKPSKKFCSRSCANKHNGASRAP